MIDVLTEKDWEKVRAIYLEGIRTGNATFEKSAPEWEKWDADHLKSCRLVARVGGEVVGWAALSPVSGRCVYGGVAEVSVYVAGRARGRGVGSKLLRGAGGSVRARRDMDAARGSFSRERGEHRAAEASRVSDCRQAREAWCDGRAVARCSPDGAAKQDCGGLANSAKREIILRAWRARYGIATARRGGREGGCRCRFRCRRDLRRRRE